MAAPAINGRWSVVQPEFRPLVGDNHHPSVRYSASVVLHEGQVVVTHGYFYDHDSRKPAWQSDAWVYKVRDNKWQRVHRGEKHGAPSARYSASAVVHDGGLYMFGGDDGGHKQSMNNYIFKAWFNELWRFDLSRYTWSAVLPAGGASSLPPKRALHCAVVLDDAMCGPCQPTNLPPLPPPPPSGGGSHSAPHDCYFGR
jgi:N-acetylneuraminic acid mutarotase